MIEQLDQLLRMRENGLLDRGQQVSALLATIAAPSALSRYYRANRALRRGRTLNHITLSVAYISRSKAFYNRLLALEFKSNRLDQVTGQLENRGLVLDGYEGVAGHPRGTNHFYVGLDTYEAPATFALRRQSPKR